MLDIQIAATAFTAGLDVATANRRDFQALADALGALYPRAPPLVVVDGLLSCIAATNGGDVDRVPQPLRRVASLT